MKNVFYVVDMAPFAHIDTSICKVFVEQLIVALAFSLLYLICNVYEVKFSVPSGTFCERKMSKEILIVQQMTYKLS